MNGYTQKLSIFHFLGVPPTMGSGFPLQSFLFAHSQKRIFTVIPRIFAFSREDTTQVGATLAVALFAVALFATFMPQFRTTVLLFGTTARDAPTPLPASPFADAADDVSTADFLTSVKYHDVIIVPQAMEAGANFIKVELTGGGLYYKIPPAEENVVFESSKKYLYHIIVNWIETRVTSTITNWGTDTSTVVPGYADAD